MTDVTTPDGVRLHVEDEGQGPPVLFLHGWCGTGKVWQPTVDRIRHARRVVRMDLRGMGRSQSKEGTIGFEAWAADLGHVINQLNLDGVTLVGWSLGVGIIHRFLQTKDDSKVAAVALIDYPQRLEEKREVADKVCHQLNKRRDEFFESFFGRMLRVPDPKLLELLTDEAKQTGRHNACEAYRAMGSGAAVEEETFGIPALLVFPSHGWFPDALADWRARFPEHEAPEFINSRHAAPIEEPDEFARALMEFTEPGGRISLSSV